MSAPWHSAALRRVAALLLRFADSLEMPAAHPDPVEERLFEMRNRLSRYY